MRPDAPKTLEELIRAQLEDCDREERQLLVERYFDGRSPDTVGRRRRRSPQGLRERYYALEARHAARYGPVASELVLALRERLEAHGGVLHRSELEGWPEAWPLGLLGLPFGIVDRPPTLWLEELVTTWEDSRRRKLLSTVRRRVRAVPLEALDGARVRLAARGTGLPERPVLAETLTRRLQEARVAREPAKPGPGASRRANVAHILEELGRPVSSAELLRRHDVWAESVGAPLLGAPSVLIPILPSHPDIFTVGAAEYVHRSALPVELSLLRAVARWGANHLSRFDHALPVSEVARALAKVSLLPEGVSVELLGDALVRFEGVVGRGARYHLWLPSPGVEEHSSAWEHARQGLVDAGRALSEEALLAALPFELDDLFVFRKRLRGMKDVLALGGHGPYVARQSAGLSARAALQIARAASLALPADGRPVGASRLLEPVEPEGPALDEASRRLLVEAAGEAEGVEPGALLWGLIEAAGRKGLAATRGELLLRSPPKGSRQEVYDEALRRLFLHLLRAPTPQTARTLARRAQQEVGWRAHGSGLSFRRTMARLVERGEAVRTEFSTWRLP